MYKTIINSSVFLFLTLIVLSANSFSAQVSGQQVGGQPVGSAAINFDEEEFRKCIENNKQKLEKAATREVWEDMLKDVIADEIISAASGGQLNRYIISAIVDKSVRGVVPDSWQHIAEAITSVMNQCAQDAKNAKKESWWKNIFGGKKVRGGGQVSGKPVH